MLTLLAPAKINLTLEVLGKRPDGFHEIVSVIQTINFCDRLSFKSSDKIEFRCDLTGWVAEASLVFKVTSLLKQVTRSRLGVKIEINKNIPLSSGLGGDSSDAAATLKGLNQLWELRLSQEELLGLARQLGSDVSFFLYGGTALAEGKGEKVTPLPSLSPAWVILIIPPIPRPPEKTKKLYESLTANDYTDGQITRSLVERLKGGEQFTSSLLFNTFEKVAFSQFSGLERYQELMVKAGARYVHLAGSGPVLFTLVKDKTKADKLYTNLRNQSLEVYLAETLIVASSH